MLLCTYNEAGNLPRVVALLREHLPTADMLVVDDNSPDGTAELVTRLAESDPRLHLLRRVGKLGLGSAIQEGIEWCLQREYDFLINLDADLSHDPAVAPRLLEACCGSGPRAEVAVGSRYVQGGGFLGLAWHRRLISRLLNGYATRLLRLPVRDCSGSYRCYQTDSLRKIELQSLRCDGYGFLEEILVALHRQGTRLVEVPILFEPRTHGHSKLGWNDIVGVIRVVHRLAWHSVP